VPAGPYRELLLDRLAQAIGVSAERFLVIVGPAPPPVALSANPGNPAHIRLRRAAPGAGRGSLLTQAIKHLVDHPAIAGDVSEARRALLAEVQEPGIPTLVSILDDLFEHPATVSAQLLERRRDAPEFHRLVELAAGEPLAPGAKAASEELLKAIDKLIDHAAHARLEQLRVKPLGDLSALEKDELRRLLSRRVPDPLGGD
jgi:hypothetical protein